MEAIDLTAATAVRTWNKARTKATVTVRIPTGPNTAMVSELGGKRAARAEAAVVTVFAEGDEPKVDGLRGTMRAAESHANLLARRGYAPRGIAPCPFYDAIAIVVTEAQA